MEDGINPDKKKQSRSFRWLHEVDQILMVGMKYGPTGTQEAVKRVRQLTPEVVPAQVWHRMRHLREKERGKSATPVDWSESAIEILCEGYWLSRRALAPVDQITRAAEDINSNNLAKRLDIPQSGDELQRLSQTLNSMLERLEASFNRITQFTADASHELRTPLALMRTTTEVSLRTSQTVADHREAQEEVLAELEKTSSLVEKLMLLARADAGVGTLQHAPLNLAECLRDACKDGRVLAAAKQLTFTENIESSDLIVEGDVHALHRLFLILMDNAVKYTPSGGSITVELKRNDDSAVTEFRDTGIGIAAEDGLTFSIGFTAPTKLARASLEVLDWGSPSHGGLRKRTEVPSKFKALWVPGLSFVSVGLFFRARLLHIGFR